MDARVVTIGFRSLDGVLVNLAGRAGIAAGAAGLEFEPVVGLGIGDRLLPIWGFAVLYGFPWFGVGISAEFPIATERPEWLETVGFALRFQLPLRPCRSQFFSCSAPSR
jgi:hypothetical protein